MIRRITSFGIFQQFNAFSRFADPSKIVIDSTWIVFSDNNTIKFNDDKILSYGE